MIAFAIVCTLGFGVLIPIYAQGHKEVDDLTQTIALNHILDDHNYVIGMIVCLFVFSLLFYFFLISFYGESMRYKRANRCRLRERSVEITYVNRAVGLVEGERLVREKCEGVVPGAVEQVMLAPRCKKLYKLLVQLQELRQDLQYYREVNQMSERRTNMISWRGRVDAEEKLTQEEIRIKNLIDDFGGIPADSNSTFAILICKNSQAASQLISGLKERQGWKIFRSGEETLNFDHWVIKPAANPQDIVWRHIGKNRRALDCINCTQNALLIFILLFLFTPTVFVTLLAEVLSDIGMELEIVVLNLPALVILLYIEVLVP